MPVNRTHAFATGVTFPVKSTRPSPVIRLASLVLWYMTRLANPLQVLQAVNSFQRNAVIGRGVCIGPNAWCANLGARENIRIGEGVICRGVLRCENWGPATLAIGDHVYIGDDSVISCAVGVEIGRLTLLAHGVQILDNDSHPTDPFQREQDYFRVIGKLPGPRPQIGCAPVRIGARAWIGINAIVTKGVQIGEGSIVAAGSVVTKDVPPYTLAAGNPARVVKSILASTQQASTDAPAPE